MSPTPARPTLILHIASGAEWEDRDAGDYTAPSLATEGFIHCSTPGQVLLPADALFRGKHGLVLLCIDARCLSAPVVYEDCYEAGQDFPHVYGPIDRAAVVTVVPFPPGADGAFSLPREVEEIEAQLS